LMLFKIGQVVVREKYLATCAAHENAEWRGMLIAALRQYAYFVQLTHAEQQSTGLIDLRSEQRGPDTPPAHIVQQLGTKFDP